MYKKLIECLWLLCLLQLCALAATDSTANDTGSDLSLSPKIVGGSGTSIERAPYQVSVRLRAREKRSYGAGHICGGTVISQRLVSTAAHCIVNPDAKSISYRKAGEFILVMGSTYLTASSADTLQYNVQQIIVHEHYNHSALLNDIALMFFNGYIPWQTPVVRALPLRFGRIKSGTNCVVTGWGTSDQGSKSNRLQVASVPIVSYEICFIGYSWLPSSQLCAGYMSGGADACQGDSGGPLACEDTLVGIVSWGNGCGVVGHPGVYTNVSYYSGWIVQQNASLNYSHYRDSGISFSQHRAHWLLGFGLIALCAKWF